ncbi:MAG: NnrU family protein [Candidatus Methanoperedens sp.]|nr:NnrU family protein [Candidatus Methanoperedens sp.]
MNILLTFTLYFLFFAVFHSILAMDHAKNKAEKLMGKGYRYYRLIYSVISFPLIIPAFLVWASASKSSPLVYEIPGDLYPLVILVRLCALGMFIYAAIQTDVLEFIGIKREKKKALITRGSYGIVRHPLYLAGILILITNMRMTQLDLLATLLISGYFVIGAFIEEKRLLSVYGEEYRQYKQQVSMFIPVKWFASKMEI